MYCKQHPEVPYSFLALSNTLGYIKHPSYLVEMNSSDVLPRLGQKRVRHPSSAFKKNSLQGRIRIFLFPTKVQVTGASKLQLDISFEKTNLSPGSWAWTSLEGSKLELKWPCLAYRLVCRKCILNLFRSFKFLIETNKNISYFCNLSWLKPSSTASDSKEHGN